MDTTPDTFKEALRPSFSLQEGLLADDLAVSACYQCRKCSSGCPLTFAMDLYPDRVIRMALLGQEDQVLGCRTIWVCSSCETCTTRCPNGIDIAGVMDWLKEESVKRGLSTPQPRVTRFHQTFLDAIRLGGGRLQEPVLLGLYTIRAGDSVSKLMSGELFKELRLAMALFRRGRLKLPHFPKRLKGAKEIKQILKQKKS
jgi:heterodisulfide reductase subunit C